MRPYEIVNCSIRRMLVDIAPNRIICGGEYNRTDIDKNKAAEMIRSLYQGNPIGCITIRMTARNEFEVVDGIKTIQVLYDAFCNYREKSRRNIQIAFNPLTGELEKYSSYFHNEPQWITDIAEKMPIGVGEEDIYGITSVYCRNNNITDGATTYKISRNVAKLVAIMDYDIAVIICRDFYNDDFKCINFSEDLEEEELEPEDELAEEIEEYKNQAYAEVIDEYWNDLVETIIGNLESVDCPYVGIAEVPYLGGIPFECRGTLPEGVNSFWEAVCVDIAGDWGDYWDQCNGASDSLYEVCRELIKENQYEREYLLGIWEKFERPLPDYYDSYEEFLEAGGGIEDIKIALASEVYSEIYSRAKNYDPERMEEIRKILFEDDDDE